MNHHKGPDDLPHNPSTMSDAEGVPNTAASEKIQTGHAPLTTMSYLADADPGLNTIHENPCSAPASQPGVSSASSTSGTCETPSEANRCSSETPGGPRNSSGTSAETEAQSSHTWRHPGPVTRSLSAGVLMKQIRNWGRKVSHAGITKSTSGSPSAASRLVKGGISPRRILHDEKPLPRYIGAYKEKVFVCEGVQHLWRVIAEAQRLNPFSDAVVGVSGGTSPKKTFEALAAMCGAMVGVVCLPRQASEESTAQRMSMTSAPSFETNKISWSRVKLFLVDERYVPPTHPASNQRMVRETLLAEGFVDIPESNLLFPNTLLPLDECVEDYDKRLRNALSVTGRPALVTLGLGDDGHIASWFPPLTESEYCRAHTPNKLVCHTRQDRGLDIAERITVSMAVIESASEKVFLLSGENKVKTWKELMTLQVPQHLKAQPVLQVLESGNVTVISYPPIMTDMFKDMVDAHKRCHLSVVIFGASGDLARKKTVPFTGKLSHYRTSRFVEICCPQGYARTPMEQDAYWKMLEPNLWNLDSFFKGSSQHQEALFKQASPGFLDEFRKRLIYVSGSYNTEKGFLQLESVLRSLEAEAETLNGCHHGHRLFYLALPPTVFLDAIKHAKQHCWSKNGWNRVVVEKPFGRDLKSSNELAAEILAHIKENETYRIDHYLGKEMVLNLMVFRFANAAFSPLMSWQFISAVRITFKETIGTAGRGGYFDQFGIIRDIMQNHLLQVLTIIAMERPASLRDDDIRDEKVKVLKQMEPFRLSETVLGQYTRSSDGQTPGYHDDPTVPKGSLTPTFCTTVLHINNERWAGVPFIMKAGKALEERLTEVRLQLRSVPGNLFGETVPQNEIVIKIQPCEAVYMKVLAKNPGLVGGLVQTELDFTVMDRLDVDRLPDAYERLLVDVIKGDKQNFVRTDELREAWRIFTPGLHEMESKQIKPIPYPANSRGPEEAYALIQKHGYKRYEGYAWEKAYHGSST